MTSINKSRKSGSIFNNLLNRLNWSPFSIPSHQKRDPGKLTEWIVEGDLILQTDGIKANVFFTWTQIGSRFILDLRQESLVGPVVAAIESDENEDHKTRISVNAARFPTETQIIEFLEAQNLYPSLKYWLRGLSAVSNTEATQQYGSNTFEEHGRNLTFDDFFEFSHYTFPREINISFPAGDIRFDIIRVETGFISNICRFKNKKETTDQYENQTNGLKNNTELPHWINSEQFCEQLEKIHGRVLDPKHGIFGPDSMMWEINRFMIPPLVGSGRALLLQISHPWVTAGIDDHSNVRNDPMERARRTFVYMYTMIYGSLPQALKAANEVHGMHKRINGELPYPAGRFNKNSRYGASEINAMIWVQATLWDTLVYMYEKTVRKLTHEEKEQFYQESKLFAMLFGIPEAALPKTWKDFRSYCNNMWEGDTLAVTQATKALSTELFRKRNPIFFLGMPVLKIITACHLPQRLRKDYSLPYNAFTRSFYSSFITFAKLLNRILPDQIRTNVMYQEANARVNGKESNPVVRMILKLGTGMPTMVN